LPGLTVAARISGLWGGVNSLAFGVARPIVTYEAEASSSVLSGKALVVACSVCSGGMAVAGVAQPGSGPTGGLLTITNVASVGPANAALNIYYQHSETSPIQAAVVVNGVTNLVSFPPVPADAIGPSKLLLIVPGANIGSVTITGVKGTEASALKIDRITVQ